MSQTVTHSYDVENTTLDKTASMREGIRSGSYPVVPDALRAIFDADERLHEEQLKLAASLIDPTASVQRLVAQVLSGEEVTLGLREAVDAIVDRERGEHASHLIRLAQDSLRYRLPHEVERALPELLAGLRTRLDRIVEQLRAAYVAVGTLDVHQPDPLEVAQATTKQRTALATIAEQTRAYRQVRMCQRDALQASAMTPPGYDPILVDSGWARVFVSGVHEVRSPTLDHAATAGLPPRIAVRAVVERDDVWLPAPDDLCAAFDRWAERCKEDRRARAAAERANAAANGRLVPGTQPAVLTPGDAAYLGALG